MASVSLHYWAGARAAAGTSTETVEAATVRDALDQVTRQRGADSHFTRVAAAGSLLVDGLRASPADLDAACTGAVRVEVLPPFAGGA